MAKLTTVAVDLDLVWFLIHLICILICLTHGICWAIAGSTLWVGGWVALLMLNSFFAIKRYTKIGP